LDTPTQDKDKRLRTFNLLVDTDKTSDVKAWVNSVDDDNIVLKWESGSNYSKFKVCWKKAWRVLKRACKSNSKHLPSYATAYKITGLKKKKRYRVKVYGITSGGLEVKLLNTTRKTPKN